LPVPVAVNAILLCIGGLGLGVGQPMTMSWLAASALKCTRPLVSSRSWSTYSGRAAPARPDPPRSPPTSRPAEQADHPLSDELLDRLGQAPDLDAAAVVGPDEHTCRARRFLMGAGDQLLAAAAADMKPMIR
jgi:hypothetical protein